MGKFYLSVMTGKQYTEDHYKPQLVIIDVPGDISINDAVNKLREKMKGSSEINDNITLSRGE